MSSNIRVDQIMTVAGTGTVTIANTNNLKVMGTLQDTNGRVRGSYYHGNNGSAGDTAAKANIFRVNNLSLTSNVTIASLEALSPPMLLPNIFNLSPAAYPDVASAAVPDELNDVIAPVPAFIPVFTQDIKSLEPSKSNSG